MDQTRTLPNPDPAVLADDPTATVSQTVTFKVPINVTSNGSWGVKVEFDAFQIPKYTASSQTWTWENFTVHSGDVYRIVEPKYEINKWKYRTLTVTASDGTVILDEELILFSDSDTLYFTPQDDPIPKGSTFQINEKQPGVYKWTGTGFVVATGSDAARVTVQTPTDFLPDPNANNNGWVKDYGIIEYGDLMHIKVLNELHAAMTLLYDTKGPLAWTNKASDDADPEKNKKIAAANTPFYTEDPTFWAYIVANQPADIPIHESAYNSFNDAWARCWQAVFDLTDSYNQNKYLHDADPSYDGKSYDDGISPRQSGGYDACYCYVDHWEYPGYYYGGCNYLIYFDDTVFTSDILMTAAYAYGKLAPQAGFKKLSASISGVVYAGISPDNPDETDWTEESPVDYCTQYGRWSSQTNQFQEAGSGVIFRKWHVYNTWSVSAGTTTAVYGPQFGSIDFLGNPITQHHKCKDVTCTYTDGDGTHDYKPFESYAEGGQIGWCVIDQFTRISWDMEGY